MASEKEWVRAFQPRLDVALRATEGSIRTDCGMRLTYADEIQSYGNHTSARTSRSYETDLLLYDVCHDETWIPRVVVECKKGGVTTHDALTYSTKAATHKHVHPYLRYGVLIGDLGTSLPGRLIRHGAYFDFMMVWRSEEPTDKEWSELVRVLSEEVLASRLLQRLLSESRSRQREEYAVLHRPLQVRTC